MKNFIVLIAASLAIFGMQSCRKTPGVTPTGSQIDILASIEGTTGAAQAVSSRASKGSFAINDTLGLWVVPFSNSNGTGVQTELRAVDNYVDNVKFKYDGTKFATTTPVFYPNAITKVDLYAMMPYVSSMSAQSNNSMTDPTAFRWAVNKNQSVGDSVVLSDAMTAFVKGAKDGSSSALLFKHRLSQVLVEFTVPEFYKEQKVLSVDKVELVGVQLVSTINVADTSKSPVLVALATNPKVDMLTYEFQRPTAPAVKGKYIYEGVIPPQSVTANTSIVRITLKVDGLGDVTFDCKTSSAHTYVQKKSTQINVSIESQTTIVLDPANVTIQAWGSTTPLSGSTVKMSRMLFDARKEGGTVDLKSIATASLSVDDSIYTATVKYEGDESKGVYTLEYDQRANWGGRLQKISFADEKGVTVVAEKTLVDAGYQIVGDPTEDTYATRIGTIVFDASVINIYNATFTAFVDQTAINANCHVVSAGNALRFYAKSKGNSTTKNEIVPTSVRVLWQTAENHGRLTGDNLVVGGGGNVSYDAGSGIATVVARKAGNAVVAAYNAQNEILWSWHIWVPATTIGNSEAITGAANEAGAGGASKTFMDRNLGTVTATASDVAAYGMLYQWGRKDPFTPSLGMPDGKSAGAVPIFDALGKNIYTDAHGLGAGFKYVASNADNLDLAIKNPMTHYYNADGNWTSNSASDQYWHSPAGSVIGYVDNRGAKTIYDPCPAGYRIAGNGAYATFPANTWTAWTPGGGTSWLGVWWPAAGRRDYSSGQFYSAGCSGYVWSSSLHSAANGFYLDFDCNGGVSPSSAASRSYGFSVRCVTE